MVPQEFLLVQERLYVPAGLDSCLLEVCRESREYAALSFTLMGQTAQFRQAKITPKKIGQFVTLWKRDPRGGPILPYEISDPVDWFIISVCTDTHWGQFLFPKQVLQEQGILSSPSKEGKRALRVYPPWDRPESRQAERTQSWQLDWFVDASLSTDLAGIHIKTLLQNKGSYEPTP